MGDKKKHQILASSNHGVVKITLHDVETMLKICIKSNFPIWSLWLGPCIIFWFVNRSSEVQDTSFVRINATQDTNVIMPKGGFEIK